MGIDKENAKRESRGHRFVRACAREMHMDISQGLLLWGIFAGKTLSAKGATSIEHRALTVTVRTPHCGHTVKIC